jgi:AcrR family transcriptional regulator
VTLLERVLTALAEPVDDDPTTAVVLDAAYEQFCLVGIQRTTMDDVAKRAGISRITVYRRIATKDALVAQVLRREFTRYTATFLSDVRSVATPSDRLVVGFSSALRAIRQSPLLSRMLAVEPDVLVTTLINDGGRTFSLIRQFVAGQLLAEQRAGHIDPAVNVDVAAELFVRICASFLLTPSDLIDLDDDEQARDLARQFLAPMLRPAG